jgi:ElaB/YqjD/DUF883 family membrane-anchored ribosome-binding protein
MRHLSLFNDFDKVEESFNFDSDNVLEAKINQMSMLKENCMASWDFSIFKDFFGGSLNENNTEEENQYLLEKAYYTYELGVLYENKQDWFTSKGNVLYLKDNSIAEGHVVLFKNEQLHIITEGTFDSLQNKVDLLLEDNFFTDTWNATTKFVSGVADDIKKVANKYVVEPVKKAAAYVGDKVSKAWDTLSSGAKAVWDFSKQIISAIGTFIKENPLTALGILIQIIGTILSFIPVAQFLAPICSLIAGGITVYEGVMNLIKAGKETAGAKKVGDIVKGGGKIIFGSAGLLLGIKDVVTAADKALPGMGSIGIAIKGSVVSWSTKFSATAFGSVASVGVGKALGCSKWLAEFFATLCEKAPFMAKLAENPDALSGAQKIISTGTKLTAKGADVALDKGKEYVLDHEEYHEEWDETINEDDNGGWGFGELVVNFLAYVGKSCFGWLYDLVIGAISGIGKAINGLLELPGKITRGIDQFKKEQGGSFVGGIISGALSSAVRPMSSCAQKFIDTYIKPNVASTTNWMTSLGKRNATISKKIDGNPNLKSPIAGVKQQGPQKVDVKKVELSSSDKAGLKKIGTTGIATIVKAGGGSEKVLDKMKKNQGEFKKEFPGVSKLNGTWGQSISGEATYTYKSKMAGGNVTLFKNARYYVLDGPNKTLKGDFKSTDKGVNLKKPKEGWKKDIKEGLIYLKPQRYFST